jgi:phospholipase D-like protein
MPVIGSEVDAEPAGAQDRLAGSFRQPPWREGGTHVTGRFVLSAVEHFWTMVEFFLWVVWIWIWIMVFIDIFRSHDLSGWAKALWFVFVLFIPLIGVLVYLIARGGKMHERAARQAQQQDAEASAYIRQAAASSPASSADQLTKLADLRDRGPSPLRSSSARRPRSWRPDPVRAVTACTAGWPAAPDHLLRGPGVFGPRGAGAMALAASGEDVSCWPRPGWFSCLAARRTSCGGGP